MKVQSNNKEVQIITYAVDLVVIAKSRKKLIETNIIEKEAKKRGLTINESKIKYIKSGKTSNVDEDGKLVSKKYKNSGT